MKITHFHCTRLSLFLNFWILWPRDSFHSSSNISSMSSATNSADSTMARRLPRVSSKKTWSRRLKSSKKKSRTLRRMRSPTPTKKSSRSSQRPSSPKSTSWPTTLLLRARLTPTSSQTPSTKSLAPRFTEVSRPRSKALSNSYIRRLFCRGSVNWMISTRSSCSRWPSATHTSSIRWTKMSRFLRNSARACRVHALRRIFWIPTITSLEWRVKLRISRLKSRH